MYFKSWCVTKAENMEIFWPMVSFVDVGQTEALLFNEKLLSYTGNAVVILIFILQDNSLNCMSACFSSVWIPLIKTLEHVSMVWTGDGGRTQILFLNKSTNHLY